MIAHARVAIVLAGLLASGCVGAGTTPNADTGRGPRCRRGCIPRVTAGVGAATGDRALGGGAPAAPWEAMHLITLTHDELSTITGGGAATGHQGAQFYDASPSAAALDGALANPSARMGGVVNPGGQVFERSNAGPSAYDRVNSAFDRSTRAMRTFNELGGALTQSPGFGNGDVLKP